MAISPPLLEFNAENFEIEEKITKEWTDSKFKPNVFVCPFFNDGGAFKECLVEIVSWCEPLLEEYIQRIKDFVRACVYNRLHDLKVPKTLIASISYAWQEHCDGENGIFQVFETECNKALQKEVDFGTLDKCLYKSYLEELKTPYEEIIEKFSQTVPAGNHQREYCINSLKTVIDQCIKEHPENSLQSHQKRLVFTAIQANYEIEKNTLVDNISKATRDVILKNHERWIMQELFTNQHISKSAAEDESTCKKRKTLNDIVDQMAKCRLEISNILI